MSVDISAFDHADFDAKAWLNDALVAMGGTGAGDGGGEAQAQARPSQQPLLSSAGMDELPGVIMKLQLLSQDAADSVESSMAQMLVALPGASGTLARLEDEVAALRQAFARVVGQAEGAEEAQDDAEFGYIAHLKALDGIKRRMDTAKSLLGEAANWERRVRDVGPVMASGDVEAASQHVAALQRSVAVMADMPESAQREAMLQRFRAQFEAMVRPQFEQAMREDRASELRRVASAFARIGMVDTLATDYARFKVQPLLAAWQERRASAGTQASSAGAAATAAGHGASAGAGAAVSSGDGGGGDDLARFVASWMGQLRALVATESRRGAARLFAPPPPSGMASPSTGNSDHGSTGTGTGTGTGAADGSGEGGAARRTTQAVLARLVEESVDGVREHLSQLTLALPAPAADVVFLAAAGAAAEVVACMEAAGTKRAAMRSIAVPFVPLLQGFVARESKVLADVVQRHSASKRTRMVDVAAGIAAGVRPAIAAVVATVQRCDHMTALACAPELRRVMSDALQSYAAELCAAVAAMRAAEGTQHARDVVDAEAPAAAAVGSADGAGTSGPPSSAGAGAGGGSDSDDWLDIDDEEAGGAGAGAGAGGVTANVAGVGDSMEPPSWDVFSRVVQVLRAAEEARLGFGCVERLTQRTLRRGLPLLQQCCAAAASTHGAASSTGASGVVDGGTESKGVEADDAGVVGSGGGAGRTDDDAAAGAADAALSTLRGACAVLYLAAAPSQARSRPLTVAQSLLRNESGPVLGAVERRLDEFTRSTQELVYDMLMRPVAAALRGVPSMQAWTSSEPSEGAGGGYSIQHQRYITGVGQYVLALVRLLQQAKGSLVPLTEGGLAALVEQGMGDWRRAATVLSDRRAGGDMEFPRPQPELAAATTIREWHESVVVGAGSDTGDSDGDGGDDVSTAGLWLCGSDNGDSDPPMPPDRVTKAASVVWLAAVARGTASLYISQILKISSLTDGGRLQLVADIDYLANLMSALGLHHPKSSLSRVRDLLRMDADELTALVSSSSSLSASRAHAQEGALRRRVAKMRQLVTTF